jgi:hypothetical protein
VTVFRYGDAASDLVLGQNPFDGRGHWRGCLSGRNDKDAFKAPDCDASSGDVKEIAFAGSLELESAFHSRSRARCAKRGLKDG